MQVGEIVFFDRREAGSSFSVCVSVLFAISVTDVFIQNFTWKIKRNTCLFSSQGYMYLGRNTVNYLDRFDAESKRTDAFVFN